MATKFTQALSPYDIFTCSSDAKLELGTEGVTPDGRRFRYVKAGSTATVAGKLYQSRAEDATNWENIAIAAASAGATSIVTTGTITAAKDLFAGGWVVIADDTGEGYFYKVKGNTAATAAVCTIYLEDPLVEAITTSTTIDVIPHIYGSVEIWDATNHDGVPVGVAVSDITANYYGWVQVGGICNVLCNGTGAVGMLAVASNAVDGSVEPAAGGSTEAFAPIGVWATGVTDTEYGAVMLNLN